MAPIEHARSDLIRYLAQAKREDVHRRIGYMAVQDRVRRKQELELKRL